MDSFLDRKTLDLLDLFAAGNNTPGAGSASALMGALAGSLLQTVARHTLKAAANPKRRETYEPFRERAAVLLEQASGLSNHLRAAVDEDAAVFERYWKDRSDETLLRRAIEVPVGIAEDCAALAEIGIELHEHGFRNAQGEAAAAILSALAGGETAAQAAWLNLKFAGEGEWAEERRVEVETLRQRLRDLRAKSSRRDAPGPEREPLGGHGDGGASLEG
jgi:glutamate formiminotransferase/formiminotetrahydrofolate cyclodeaminase